MKDSSWKQIKGIDGDAPVCFFVKIDVKHTGLWI